MIPFIKRYIDLGFVVHPCCPADHYCKSPGKIPFDPIEGKHMAGWQDHEQFSLEQWQEWLDYESSINVGFLCGAPSGIACLDIDDMRAKEILNAEGYDGWDRTWQFTTGRGLRCLFRSPQRSYSGIVARGDIAYEILGDGRQSVLPPSLHPNGNRYEWVAGCTPRDIECVEAGEWAVRGSISDTITSDREDWSRTVSATTPKGGRNITMTRLAGHLMHPGPMPADEAYLWLSLYNEKHCKPPLSDREVQAIISSIRKREEVQQSERDVEIRKIMRQYDLNYEEAESVWRGM